MTHLESELKKLNHSVINMLSLSKMQLEKSREAFMKFDKELVQEIFLTEKRIDAYELSIDRDCENIFALYTPVAIDLRFVLSMLKINSSIERMGDLANAISKQVNKLKTPYDPELLKLTKIEEMFDIAISLCDDILESMVEEDTKKARKVFKNDEFLDKLNKEATLVIQEYVKKNPTAIEHALFLFSTFTKLERIGDYTKNIAEEIVFHVEAKVVKHKKLKKISKENTPEI